MPYQHYTYGATHYPAAAYSHFQQYQATQPAATTAATTTTSSTASAPLSRQPTQTTQATTATISTPAQPAQPESTDVMTLNDALGSAGVDLRVSGIFSNASQFLTGNTCRQRKRHCKDHKTITPLTAPMKIALVNSLIHHRLIREYSERQCVI